MKYATFVFGDDREETLGRRSGLRPKTPPPFEKGGRKLCENGILAEFCYRGKVFCKALVFADGRAFRRPEPLSRREPLCEYATFITKTNDTSNLTYNPSKRHPQFVARKQTPPQNSTRSADTATIAPLRGVNFMRAATRTYRTAARGSWEDKAVMPMTARTTRRGKDYLASSR